MCPVNYANEGCVKTLQRNNQISPVPKGAVCCGSVRELLCTQTAAAGASGLRRRPVASAPSTLQEPSLICSRRSRAGPGVADVQGPVSRHQWRPGLGLSLRCSRAADSHFAVPVSHLFFYSGGSPPPSLLFCSATLLLHSLFLSLSLPLHRCFFWGWLGDWEGSSKLAHR